MNVALGFDSYLVMRHGVAAAEPPASTADVETPSSAPAIAIKGRLGCYFCNDIVAPGDVGSGHLRGTCAISADGSVAVAHGPDPRPDVHGHPARPRAPGQRDGGRDDGVCSPTPRRASCVLFPEAERTADLLTCRILAQADLPTSKGAPAKQDAGDNESVLGIVPHQIRGFLARFDNMKLVGPAYDKCTGCSDTVRVLCLRVDDFS